MAAVSIYYQNVRGMRTKTENILKNILLNEYDVIALTETWLNASIENREFIDNRYTVYRRDRQCYSESKKDGGGVLLAVSKKISSYRFLNYESEVEDLWVTIELKINGTIRIISICVVYLPPPVSLDSLTIFLTNTNNVLEQSNQTVIIGDFNLSFFTWSRNSDEASYVPTNYNCKSGHLFVDFLSINNLRQVNEVLNVNNKLLDLVLTDFNTVEVTKAPNVLSKLDPYHPPLLISLKDYKPNFINPSRNPKYNFFKADYTKITQYLNNVNWNLEFASSANVNDMTTILYNYLNMAIQLYTPTSLPRNTKFPPWFTKSLIRLLAEKERMRRKYRKYKNPRDSLEYEILRERGHKLQDQCLKTYKTRIERNIISNPKAFWRFVKDRRNGDSTIPSEMHLDDRVAKTGPDIAELFASNFSSVFDKNPLVSKKSHSMGVTSNLCRITISEKDISRGIRKLDIYKGAGPDEIPPIFLQRCGAALVLPLFIIFNRSLKDGVFPDEWKRAKIVPIFKKGDIHDTKNYRPISILSCLSKLFESLVCPIITRHIDRHLSDHQHGFRSGRSTQTNLVSFVTYLAKHIDNNQQIDAIYTDFSNAFDKVNHSLLISKLNNCGIENSLLHWFNSYLAKRLLVVVVNGHKSHEYYAESGVPQGSHLGPILFSVFINDITSAIKNCKFSLFADDLKIFRTVKTTTDIQQIQDDLDRVNTWCKHNGMIMNPKKCFHIKYTRKQNLVKSSYVLSGEQLSEVTEIRDLGVVMDSKLKFTSHIDSIVKKSARMLGFIRRNTKGFLSPQTKIILYCALVRSHLEYSSVVWTPLYSIYSQRIESIQRSFTRHLAFHASGISHRTPYDLRLKQFNMISLHRRREILDILFLKKLLSGAIVSNNLLNEIRLNVPSRYPRHPLSKLLYIPVCRTNVLKHSPLPRMCAEYNRLCNIDKNFDIFFDTAPTLKQRILALT